MKNRKLALSDFNLFCITRHVLKNFWLVILLGIIFYMGTYLAQNLLVTPSYSSSMTISVTSRSAAASSVGSIAATDTVSVQFAEMLDSALIKSAAAEKMGMSYFPADISVRVPENTNILRVTLTAATPEEVFRSALAVIEVYPEYSSFILNTATLELINSPSIPTQPAGAATREQTLQFAGPLGAVLMIILLVLHSILLDTVQTVSGAKQQVDGKLLSTIPYEHKERTLKNILHRKKKSLLISDPTCSFYYTEAVHQLRLQFERAHENKQIFVVTSCNENEGKSTVAANIALSLAQKHENVLLIDADFRKPAQSLVFETSCVPGKGFDALLSPRVTEKDVEEAVVYSEATNLHTIFTQPVRRSRIESLTADSFRPVFAILRKKFSFIIIDSSPLRLFMDSEVVSDAADASVLVVRQDDMPAIAINDAIDSLTDCKAKFLGFVLNHMRSFRTIIFGRTSYGYGYGAGYGYGYGYGNMKQRSGEQYHRTKKGDKTDG
ncbi:MAG: polysaccharide biosynthesis tyrosine autokinase [Oscillospiraceae bacterium]|jgi:capsular exopolysaccharide synthesis family protein|nr:polysaccharide biosynthesis tyrosine autokinase [Oscillospiraceae bacterium]